MHESRPLLSGLRVGPHNAVPGAFAHLVAPLGARGLRQRREGPRPVINPGGLCRGLELGDGAAAFPVVAPPASHHRGIERSSPPYTTNRAVRLTAIHRRTSPCRI